MPRNFVAYFAGFLFCLLLMGEPATAVVTPTPSLTRSYTLQRGQQDFTFDGGYAYRQRNGGFFAEPVYLLDASYRRAYSEDYTLVISPIAAGVQYRVNSPSEVESLVSWRLDLFYLGKFGLGPTFNSFWRWHETGNTAMDFELEYRAFVPFDEPSTLWSASFELGPVFFLSERWAVKPTFQIASNDSVLHQLFIVNDQRSGAKEEDFQLVFPFTLRTEYSFSERQQLQLGYSYRAFGINQNFRTHLFLLSSRWEF